MAIRHKLEMYNFKNGFETKNAILHTPFNPEVIFIGTFNHGWDWNNADFYYGRGMYMWTILGNLFLHNKIDALIYKRTSVQGNNHNPTVDEIFEICKRGRITFADVVLGTIRNLSVEKNPYKQSVLVNNSFEWKGYKDKPLDKMGANGWLEDNVSNIITYIKQTGSIKHVYFTFKSGGWLAKKMNLIIEGIQPVSACSIFTPTGNGFRKNLHFPYNLRSKSLAHCWVWNKRLHMIPVHKPGYGHLDHGWLRAHQVNPDNF